MKLILLGVAFLLAVCTTPVMAGDRQIMAWGPKPAGEAANFVNSLRFGCASTPRKCIASYRPHPGIEFISIVFSPSENPKVLMDRVLEFSKLSLEYPVLREVGVDDAWTFLRKVDVENKGKYINDLIDGVKSANPKMQFSVTIYEDEIEKMIGDFSSFPGDARAKVDRVALYLHYREGWRNYRNYVAEVKKIFPRARIFGGVYHYDRVDYLPCKIGGTSKCRNSEEVAMFSNALKLQIEMLNSNEIQGLEIHPGFLILGNEDNWVYWSRQEACFPERKRECAANSKIMAKEMFQLLK